MKLIICEKPDLARKVAKAIGKTGEKTEGYFKCNNDILVTYVFGHLLDLVEPKNYQENEGKKWGDYNLPFIPDKFLIEIKRDIKTGETDKGISKQLNIIHKLSQSAESIIHCGDADREGQIIIDNVIEFIKYQGEVFRLWLPEQTDESIRDALSNMKNNQDYRNLFNEGSARRKIDYLLGNNLTIYLTNKTSTLLKVGRVLVPIVKFIYDRDKEIYEFVSREYFICEYKDNNLVLRYNERFDDISEAENKARILNMNVAKVTNIEKKKIKKSAPKLFSLSTLQSELSKKHKMKFQESLPIIQKLYEQGYLTYPRTNTEYLSSNEYDKISKVIEKLKKFDRNIENKNIKKIYDDSKIESHSAITPTIKIADQENLTEKEKIVYNTVLKRFLANFTLEETEIEERSMYITVGKEEFILKGQTLVKEGFYKYEEKEIKDELPDLKVGEEFDVNFEVVSRKTKPPKHLTEADLSNLLKRPFKKDEIDSVDDTEEYKDILAGVEIGTEATRTQIIENAIKTGYIEQIKNSYKITPKGIFLINSLNKLNINLYKEKSVELSMLLKKIYKYEITEQDLLNVVCSELNSICNSEINIDRYLEDKEVLGQCLECKYDIIENTKAYTCTNKECRFVIFKEKNFFTFRGAKLTKTMVKNLLKTGKTNTFTMKAKTGKEYKVRGVYKGLNEKGYVEFDVEFVKTRKKKY